MKALFKYGEERVNVKRWINQSHQSRKSPKLQFRHAMYVGLLLLCGCMFLFASCEREEDVSSGNNNGPVLLTGDSVTVNFTVSEMKYGKDEVYVRSADAPSGKLKSETKVFPLSEDLDMHLTLAADEPPVELRALVPLDEHAKVRIVAYTGLSYDINSGYADYEIDAVGNLVPLGAPMTLPTLDDCKFVAYSYHDSLSFDAFADTTANITARDVLWGTTTRTIGGDSATIHITMYHLFAQVKLEAVLGPGAGSLIDGITNARVSTFDPMLVVRTGDLILDPATTLMGTELFTFASSGSAAIWSSDSLTVFMDGETASVEIYSVEIDGTVYTGPFFADYLGVPIDPGTSYTLRVRFLKRLSGSGAPRITWEPPGSAYPAGRYVITTDPTDAGLYFKYGSVTGIFSGAGTTQTLTPPVPSVSAFSSATDIAWSPGGLTVTNPMWLGVPYASFGDTINYAYHSAANVKSGLGDPCRLVGLDLDYIKNTMTNTEPDRNRYDNHAWRLPTAAELQSFADPPSNYSAWTQVSDINGRYFMYPTDNNFYFYPAAGYRDTYNGAVYGQNEANRSGDYWSNTPFSTPSQGYSLNFDDTQVYVPYTSSSHSWYAMDHGFPVRCIQDPFYHISVELVGYSPQNRYLLNGSTYEMKVYSNTAWNIKSISGVTYNTGSGTVFTPSPMLASLPGGTGAGNVPSGESVYFTVVDNPAIWGSMTVTFESVAPGNFNDYEVTIIFALPKVKIMGIATYTNHYGYNVAMPTQTARDAQTMLTTPANFGTTPNSTVYCEPFEWIFANVSRNMSDLTLQGYLNQNPDIIVMGYNTNVTVSQAAMYKNFMDQGGVLIAILEDNVGNGASQRNLMNAVFGPQSPAITCTTSASLNGAGAVYQLTYEDDIILNGPFGDIRGQHWGEDASATGIVNNLPNLPGLIMYSNGNDQSRQTYNPGMSAFRYQNMIYIGDSGFLSSSNRSGEISNYTICPFMIDNITKKPIFKPSYGWNTSRQFDVYNSVFFGNIMAWAVMQVGTTTH